MLEIIKIRLVHSRYSFGLICTPLLNHRIVIIPYIFFLLKGNLPRDSLHGTQTLRIKWSPGGATFHSCPGCGILVVSERAEVLCDWLFLYTQCLA